MSSLVVDMLSHRYTGDHWAVRDVSLRLERGVLALVGPNGAGKTTLLRVLATLLTPTAGVVSWDGQDILRRPDVLRRTLGYVPQDFGVYPQLSAREFLAYIGELKGLRGVALRHEVNEVLGAVRLVDEADVRLGTFSGGMIRRIGIAQALLGQPRLLVLDEPTVGLDPAERMRFRELLATLPEDRLVVLSTHIIADVEAVATDLALLQHGRLVWGGSPAGLLADAQGHVWAVTLSATDFRRLRMEHRVTAAVRHAETVEARVLADARPHPAAVEASPTLEEAYLVYADVPDALPTSPAVARP